MPLAQTDLGFQIQWDVDRENGTIELNRLESQLTEFLVFLNQNNLRLSHLECRRKTLDDLFTSMTGRRLHE
jgi:ABC-2 type transport system ATP-binding protein